MALLDFCQRNGIYFLEEETDMNSGIGRLRQVQSFMGAMVNSQSVEKFEMSSSI